MAEPATRTGDMKDWIELDFAHALPAIRVEDRITEREYVLRAELPGLDPGTDLRISTRRGVLTLRAERREQRADLHRTEFRYGVLQRSVRLPAHADESGIRATYRAGLLEVTVPLTAPQPAGRPVGITTAE